MIGALPADWRRSLRRQVGWMLLVKLIGLMILRSMFFSAEHRLPVNESTLAQRLAIEPGSER